MNDIHGGGSHPVIRVAVLHSQLLTAAALTALLERADFDVVAAPSTWEGLLAHPAMPADVVVLDPHLPDGVLVSTRVRELAALGSSTVVLSRRSDATSVASAMHAGARAFVATNDSPADLVSAIRTASQGGQHLAAHHARAASSARDDLDAGLGPKEERAIVLYSSGRSLREVAEMMDTTEDTVKSYVKRARRKYRERGIEIGTRQLLRDHAQAQGWTPHD